MTRKELKELSKSQLRGNWKIPVLLMLASFAIIILLGMISTFTFVLSPFINILVQGSVVVCFCNFFLKFSNTNGAAVFDDVLVSSSVFFKGLGYTLVLTIMGLVIGWLMGMIMLAGIINTMFTYGEMGILGWVCILLTLLMVAVCTVLQLGMTMTPFIYVDNENVGVFEAISISFKMMKGNKWKLFVLQLSFIGWAILCVLTFGIGYLWLVPYISLTTTNFYKDLSSNYNVYYMKY